MESIVTKEIARNIVKAKLVVIVPLLILALFWALYRVYSYTDNLEFVFQKIFPFTLLLGLIIFFIGINIAVKERLNYKYSLDEKILVYHNGEKKKTLEVKRIQEIQENKFGLTVSGKSKTIYLPRQLDNYKAFKDRLYYLHGKKAF